jgi:uncharacterized membrane protein YoaK (UPF0700 family)
MTVSTCGDISLLSVFSMWTEVVILLTSFTVFIVQVNNFEMYLRSRSLWVISVILCISTLEVI